MNNYIKHITLFVGLVLLQFIFLNNFILFDYAFCFIYIAVILLLPYETPTFLLIAIAFALGITIDIFSDSLGMNAAASVLIAFLRPFILKLITPKGGYDLNFTFSIYKTGFGWFFIYASILIFVHHFFLFLLDASDASLFFNVLSRTLASTLLTLTVLIIGQYLFLSSKKK